jgi:hypothetical protein
MFSLYLLCLAITNVFIVLLYALRPKMLETCDPSGVGLFCPDPGGVTCLLPFLSLAEQMFLLYLLCLAEQMFLLYHFVP